MPTPSRAEVVTADHGDAVDREAVSTTDPVAALTEAGVSLWLDDLSRERLTTGAQAELVAHEQVRDGRVSIEVTPRLAHDTAATVGLDLDQRPRIPRHYVCGGPRCPRCGEHHARGHAARGDLGGGRSGSVRRQLGTAQRAVDRRLHTHTTQDRS